MKKKYIQPQLESYPLDSMMFSSTSQREDTLKFDDNNKLDIEDPFDKKIFEETPFD